MTGIAVVLGGAVGAFEELATASRIAPVRYLVAVNDAASHYPGELDAFVTLHPEKLSGWLGARRTAGLPEPKAVIAHTRDVEGATLHVTEIAEYQWPEMKGVEIGTSGSSGLFATKIALERTAFPVVLCGVPMQADRAHFWNDQPWNKVEVDSFVVAWQNVAKAGRLTRVRSMSGWTATLLGGFGTPEALVA